MDDRMVPLSSVLDLIGDICLDCQAKIRHRLGSAPIKGNLMRDRTRELLEQASRETGVTITRMLEKSNVASVVAARRRFAILAREQNFSYPEIGAALGKHHTTIMHLVKSQNGAH
jgi:chromosomal replication initiation ATPase DnaA